MKSYIDEINELPTDLAAEVVRAIRDMMVDDRDFERADPGRGREPRWHRP